MTFIQSLNLPGLLSFPPDAEPLALEPLNVVIGPNGSGKSNLIEAFEILRTLSTDFGTVFREGGGSSQWFWKGNDFEYLAKIELVKGADFMHELPISYRLEFMDMANRPWIYCEEIEGIQFEPDSDKQTLYYRYRSREATIRVQDFGSKTASYQNLGGKDVTNEQSVFSQRRDLLLYPELTWLGRQFSSIQTFREWSFGRNTALRKPQPTDLPDDQLLPDASNLAVILNGVEQSGEKWNRFNELLKKFFPRFNRMTTRTSGGAIQFYLHELDFDKPIPATRISDGTLRFVAMLAVLLSPNPPPLVCIEEPELGLHPDAVMLMGDVLKEASERMQLVVTTHSNALVSAFSDRANAVVTCERPDAGTVLRRLDPNELADLLEDHTLGHLWRQGELGANP